MTRLQMWIGAATVTLVATGIFVGSRPMLAQQPLCLHDANESAAEQSRRQDALRLTRRVNSAQSVAFSQARVYQSFEGLASTLTIPQGFNVHLATDGERYVFSVKDTLDACGFAYFSDENGLIYSGQALR